MVQIIWKMKTKNLISIILILGILMPGCMKDELLQLPFSGFNPEELVDGWEISTPSAEGFDQEALTNVYKDIFNEELYPNIRSLLIVRNGKLISEAYFKDLEDRERIHAVMSVTKSITSLLAGLALDKALIASLDDPLHLYLPEYFDDDTLKQDITIRHLLTMETGLDHDNDIHTHEMVYCNGSSLEYELSRPMVFTPGTDWYYGDGNPQLISGIIQRVTGKTMDELAMEQLFKPLGIHEYYWERHSDGLSLGGMGLWLIPRDMAKIGQLMLNGGAWGNRQLISEEWVSASTIRQANHRDYGYYWLTSGNNTFWASGKGGQLIWVYPKKELVVVITSDSFAKGWMLSKGSYDKIFQDIYAAIIN